MYIRPVAFSRLTHRKMWIRSIQFSVKHFCCPKCKNSQSRAPAMISKSLYQKYALIEYPSRLIQWAAGSMTWAVATTARLSGLRVLANTEAAAAGHLPQPTYDSLTPVSLRSHRVQPVQLIWDRMCSRKKWAHPCCRSLCHKHLLGPTGVRWWQRLFGIVGTADGYHIFKTPQPS